MCKKIFWYLFAPLAFSTSFAQAQTPACPFAYGEVFVQCMANLNDAQIEHVLVTGVRPTSPEFSLGGPGYLVTPITISPREQMGGIGPVVNPSTADTLKKECLAKADTAKQTCNNAYSTLNGLCRATSALIGRGVGWAGGKLISDTKLIEIAKSAGTLTGVEADILSGGCANVHQRAENYCAAGAAKLVAQCN